MEKNLKKLSEFARSIGINHFALLLRSEDGKLNTFHFEDMKMSDLVNLMIGGFLHVIQTEVNNHPEYPPSRKRIYGDLQKEFVELVKKYDQKIIASIEAEKK